MQTITTQRQRELIDKLTRLVAQRAQDEVGIRERHAARVSQAKLEHDQQRQAATTEFENQHSRLITEYKKTREEVIFQYESGGYALSQEEDRVSESANSKHTELLEDAKTLCQHRRLELERTYQEQEVLPKKELAQFRQQCEYRVGEIQKLVTQAQNIVRRRGDWPEDTAAPPQPPIGLSQQECTDRVSAAMIRAGKKIYDLQHEPMAKFLEDGWPVLIFLFAVIAAAYPLWLLLGQFEWVWVVVADLIGSFVLALAVRQVVRPIARRRTLRMVPEFQHEVAQARVGLVAALHAAQAGAERAARRLLRRHKRNMTAATEQWETTRDQEKVQHQARMTETAAKFTARRKLIEDKHERQLEQVESKYPPQIEQVEKDFEQRMLALSETNRQRRIADQQQFESQWNELVTSWSAGLAEFELEVGEMNQFCADHFPAWKEVNWETWQPRLPAGSISSLADLGPSAGGTPASASLDALQFGHYEFNLGQVAGGLPQDDALEMPKVSFELPAVLSYPQCPSLLLEAEGEGRDAATSAIQNVMLRLLTSFPPGKVRFTIIDPVGLGQNFSAFMHLADYDEKLVASRIWTESAHVNQRLADLTEHMENVIQKYLRNEFASIQEYNAHAGEVAEPLQILVIANFPANFSDEAARRLASIASSGARCGVYTLISTDTKLKLPRNFDLADLESQATTLVWDAEQQRFAWKFSDLNPLPLTLGAPPDDDCFTRVVCAVGKLAKSAARVEVPFESIVPASDKWWNADSRGEIEVPLGRAGAKKLQYMRLGKGTSQHVLISGKTGSGKSTLLNAMITNLAVHYSPSELQFYLIDFKKGVEFKAYATFRLPHAQVIAIESEREFGMSVLERLDLELKQRGDLFRKMGVQDVKGFRNADPTAVMPRILLVIDEFQEFFTSDDKISHDSALLLDRLVRQGRAFGIHVLLGSQTLAGAYSLARSTIGQMAVRIALQCSEADAHLILSEDNTAARLLSRPGEAIYNDANGLFEGNHPFQVVWLSDHQRETYLRRLSVMGEERVGAPPHNPTIFEGNVAANPVENSLLQAVIECPAPVEIPQAPRAWLGAAVAIKDPTDVVFRRQGGNNLLIVGQQEELSLGILANSVLALAAQLPPASPSAAVNQMVAKNGTPANLRRFYVLDGTRPDSPEAGFWNRLVSQGALDGQVVLPRDAGQVVSTIGEEVARRLAAGEQNAEPIFLVIYNLARFRDLKKSDDFGSSFDDDGATGAAKHLTTILREGPALGVHTLIWCDSYSNVTRWLDRSTMRDLEIRVLFQMSATDSSNLMDSPAASRLGAHMAICYSEEQGQAEKFRPYGLPTPEWLASVFGRLASRPAAVDNGGLPEKIGDVALLH